MTVRSNDRRKSLPLAILISAIALAAPGGALAHHEGCTVTGSGQAGVYIAECSYIAPDDSQNVLVATANHWEMYVLRENCPTYPYTCKPKLVDGCQPAPDNTCQPLRDANGNIYTQTNKVVLLEGSGVPTSPLQEVNPRADEEVFVRIDTDCSVPGVTPACGGWGFITAGVDDGHP